MTALGENVFLGPVTEYIFSQPGIYKAIMWSHKIEFSIYKFKFYIDEFENLKDTRRGMFVPRHL